MQTQKQHAYQLDDLLVAGESQQVLRDGKPLDLPRLSRKFLIALIESAPAPLTQAQIAESVWNGRHVSTDTITQRVRLLRRSLGDDAHQPRYIALERGVGYRIVPPVRLVHLTPAGNQPPVVRDAILRSNTLRVAAILAVVATLCMALFKDTLLTRATPHRQPSTAALAPKTEASLAAQEHFQRGEFYYHRRDAGDLQRAEDNYLQAIALAPRYAAPWVSLAAVNNLKAWNGDLTTGESVIRQQHALNQALSLQPDLAIAHARLGRLVYLSGGPREQGQAHIDRALALAPEDPMVLAIYGGDLELRGENEAAMALVKKVVQLEPTSPLHRINLVNVYLREGLLQNAEGELRTLLNLHPGKKKHFSLAIAQLHLLKHEPQAAMDSLSALLPPEDQYFVHALAYHQLENQRLSDFWLTKLRELETPHAIARHGEAMHYLGRNVPVDETLRRVLSIRTRNPALLREVTRAGEELVQSPFIDQSSPALRSQRMLAVYNLNGR